VRDVLAFARLTEAVALDRAREDHRRRALVRHGLAIGVVDLHRIMAADAQRLQLVVREVLDHLEQPRVGAPEVLAQVGAVLDNVALVLTVDDIAHPLDEHAIGVLGEERVPLRPPQDLDDVPADAAEHRLQFLDDLAVAADRAVEALQVAVDDEDQVVELLARRQRDRAERFRLVRFAVAEERPDLLVRRRLEAAILQVAHEARVVDRHERPEAHRNRRVLPEVRHQPWMRVRRQAAVRTLLVPEVAKVLLGQPPLEERPGVDAGRGVALVVDDVGARAGVLATEEVVERDLVEGRGRGVGRDVAADAVRLAVAADDHRHGVPADQALDAALDVAVTRIRHLLVGGNRVDVRGRRLVGQPVARSARSGAQRAEQPHHAALVARLQDVVERLEPFPGFDGLEVRGVGGRDVFHDGTSSGDRITFLF
jgi:hypothetical protein